MKRQIEEMQQNKKSCYKVKKLKEKEKKNRAKTEAELIRMN